MKKLAVVVALLAATPALATNGLRMTAFSPLNASMGGAGVAIGMDSSALVLNPAPMADLGSRVDFGAAYFPTTIKYSATNSYVGTGNPSPVLTQLSAEFALEHRDVLTAQTAQICADRALLLVALQNLPGVTVYPSEANFIFVDFERDIEEVFQSLLREGIIIRPGKVWGYPTCGRITIGRRSDNRRFIKALGKILK